MSRIILVRHGQASFGKKEYDRLSTLGRTQAGHVGRALADRGVQPSRIITGSMHRQLDTAAALSEAAGWAVPTVTDGAWDEYAHGPILTAYKPAYRSMTVMKADLARTLRPMRAFDEMYAVAMDRWVAGDHASDYDEPFEAFGRRVLAGLEAVAEDLGRTETAVVVSSAGAISWVTASALDGGAPVWTRLQRVIANASVTTLTVGASGPTLRTFNDTSHFDQHPDLLTLR